MKVGWNTRLIIKNLPLTLDSAGVQRLVSQKCKDIGLTPTDCKLLTKRPNGDQKVNGKDGKHEEVSRGLCFVGFLEESDAAKFKDYYNGTYFRACKVTVEYSRPPHRTDEEDPKPEKRRREKVIARSQQETSDGEVAKTLVKQVNKYTKAGISNVRSHTVFEDEEGADGGTAAPAEEMRESDAEGDEQDVDDLENLDRVILFNLPYNITEAAIRELCRPFGPVVEIHLPLNDAQDNSADANRLTKGYCYVRWMFPSDAVKFRDAKNATVFCGRLLHVKLAKPKEDHKESLSYQELVRRITRNNEQRSSYKRELQKKKMSQAEAPTIWNTLHIDINATLNAVARQLEMGKKDIIQESDAAVNAALSETLVLNKLTKWLDQQGIDYQQFQVKSTSEQEENDEDHEDSRTITRSDDTMIIKNLPSEASESELLELFSKYGQLLRLSISPYVVMGIVQYLDAKSAKEAFKRLAYFSYQGLPLYLEWAPVKLFHEGIEPPPLPGTSIPKEEVEEPTPKVYVDDREGDPEEEADGDIVTNVSVYLKNLNFKTRDKVLASHFSGCKGYISSKVVMKDNGTLSRGFGFVEFDSLANAKAAIRSKTGLIIDGKVIEMSIAKKADKKVLEVSKSKVLKATTKIIVKNLAFQATKQDLYKMFGFYGNVKSVRIPKSMKSNNRGFAFVEFMNKHESAQALESLQHTHLYGRHLILEFAEEESEPQEE